MLKKLSELIVKNRMLVVILTIAGILLSLVAMTRLKVNYDMYTYLPEGLTSVEGQRMLTEEFGLSGKVFLILPQRPANETKKIIDRIQKIKGVTETFWFSDMEDVKIPKEFASKQAVEMFLEGDETIVQVTVNSRVRPMMEYDAEIRESAGEGARTVGGYLYTDQIREMSESARSTTLIIAVACVLLVLIIALVQPAYSILFMVCTGLSVLFNFGLAALWKGQISFVSSSVSAALQLAVTMDFSIFLLHRYEEEKDLLPHNEAMAHAIAKTTVSIASAAVTTVAGFLAMMFMSLWIGQDLGIVMAQGVLIGFVVTVTILPSILLFLDKPLSAIRHRNFIPNLAPLAKRIVTNKALLIFILAVIGIVAFIGNSNQPLTYSMAEGIKLEERVQKDFDLVATKFGSGKTVSVLLKNMPDHVQRQVESELLKIEGIKKVSGPGTTGMALVPEGFIPEKLLSKMKREGLVLVTVTLREMDKEGNNKAFADIQKLEAMHKGEMFASGTDMLSYDIARTANSSMNTVAIVTIVSIFLIVLATLRKFWQSIIVVATIQTAIWTNISFLWFANSEPVFFFASIAIGAIQLGATVDYSILITTRFEEELTKSEPIEAMIKTIKEAGPSIITSAMTLFVATFAIAMTSQLSMIKDLGSLLARGSLISGLFVVVFLPALLLVHAQISRRKHA